MNKEYFFHPGDGAGHAYPETLSVKACCKEKAETKIKRRYYNTAAFYYIGMRYLKKT